MSNQQVVNNLFINGSSSDVFISMVTNLITNSIDDEILQAGINQSLTDAINTRKDNISLDIQSIKYSDFQNKTDDDKCMICMQRFKNDDDISNMCHLFHLSCLEEWVKYKPECPTCRNKININIQGTVDVGISLEQCEECGENYESGEVHECEEDVEMDEDEIEDEIEISYDALEVSEDIDSDESSE